MDIIFDMETSDPDDVFTLCWLAGHPHLSLRAVTLTPGSRSQVGLVRRVFERLGRPAVPIGARNPETPGEVVSGFHHTFLGNPPPSDPDAVAHELLAITLTAHPDAIVLTGAPLHNLRLLLTNHPQVQIRRWVAQGGFAGDSVVPAEHRLSKFAGRETCPTFNFGGDPRGATAMLSSPRVCQRDLVSKNVCHGIVYDEAMHACLTPHKDRTPGLALIHEGMGLYLRKHPGGKMFHDPLAATVAVDRSVVTFAEVEMYTAKGEWGARKTVGTNTFISVAVDRERFFRTFILDGDRP